MAETRVDTSRITFGEMITAAAGGALILFMLLPWFSGDVAALSDLARDLNAWQTFAYIDVLVFFAAIGVIGLVVVKAAEPVVLDELPWPPASVALVAGAVTTLAVLFRLVIPPDVEFGGVPYDTAREIGVFLGFLAALGMLAGGWLQRRESQQQ